MSRHEKVFGELIQVKEKAKAIEFSKKGSFTKTDIEILLEDMDALNAFNNEELIGLMEEDMILEAIREKN